VFIDLIPPCNIHHLKRLFGTSFVDPLEPQTPYHLGEKRWWEQERQHINKLVRVGALLVHMHVRKTFIFTKKRDEKYTAIARKQCHGTARLLGQN
jgi:hypothetical protein